MNPEIAHRLGGTNRLDCYSREVKSYSRGLIFSCHWLHLKFQDSVSQQIHLTADFYLAYSPSIC